ncbi:raffinose/stachyose/melibiose transport system permease protein [Kribbella aluminosa]|uniref:Raffinose/stachyose/melibiose transport system permease protein n=1 Tax=Kribbella aluminosa TaxID=416017 RepID=A0ABS4UWA6_9ACTN|nr:sugar ABC transporter permease [Kribbella aluminosa]MBP2355938.1 raffinose/stachyose/melibiose transport system permease protein [Kribbella aluminosa]
MADLRSKEDLLSARDGPSSIRRGRPQKQSRRKKTHWGVYGALAPLAITLLVFQYYPALNGIWNSFWNWNPGFTSTFTGFDNYIRMFGDTVWWQSFGNLGIIFAFSIVTWVFPLLAAELLVSLRSQRAQFVFRTLLIVPMAFPGIVTALVWSFLYQPNSGVLNEILRGFALGDLAQNWLGDSRLALLALLFIGFPFVAGLPFLIFYSTLQNVPKEIFEACAIDGVGRVRRLWAIDIPLMARQVQLLVILVIIQTLQYGFVAYVLTHGGPDNATMVPVLYMLSQAYDGQAWGYAATLSTTLFALTVLLSAIVAVFRRKDSTTNVKGL